MVNAIPEQVLKKMRRVGALLNQLAVVSPPLAGRAAFTIFCMPRRQGMREKDKGFLSGAKQGTLFSGGQKIRTYTWQATNPEARVVLFLHGWESNSARWYKYVQKARKAGFTVQAFDAPASGNSSGRFLNALVYSRTLRDFIAQNGTPYAMVAHSLGGAAAVFSATLLGAPRPQKMALLATFSESVRVIRDFAFMLGAGEKVVKALFNYLEKLAGLPVEAYSVRQKAAVLSDVEGLVVHDSSDDVTPVQEGRDIAAGWKCRFMETQGFGHRLQDDSVVRAVLEFLIAPAPLPSR